MLKRVVLSIAVSIASAGFAACEAAAQTPAVPPGGAPSGARTLVTEFGAVGDGKTMNTAAIQKGIDHIAEAGGGVLVVPSGTFVSGAIFLKPGVNLLLEKEGVLKGSTDINDYPKMRTRVEGHFEEWPPALVNAIHADHLQISGEGTLDGSGKVYWDEFGKRRGADRTTTNLGVPRPRLMCIFDSKGVSVTGIHFKDSGFWNLHIYKCDGVNIDGLDIRAPRGAYSSDGIDVDSCQNVNIHACTISNSDDCIALKGSKGPLAMDDKDSPPVEHIHIWDCNFEQGGSFVTCGSEATYVRDVLVEHCKATGPNTRGMSVVRLKLRPDTPQDYENITIRDISLEADAGSQGGQLINVAPWTQFFDLQGHAPPSRSIKNLTLSNIHGTFGSFGSVVGNPGDVIENVTMENIDVKLTNATPRLVGIKNLTITNVKLNGVDYTGPAPTTQP